MIRVLILIPILNPSECFFSDVINKLLSQTMGCKILIINSGNEIPSSGEYEVINILKQEFNHANTRNIALEYEADFYIFMTQDATPYDDYLIENLLKNFNESSDIVVSYARHIPYLDADDIERFARSINYPEITKIKSKSDLPDLGIKTFFSSDTCAMYKSDYFKQVGGFKKNLNTNEDMEFVARAILNGKKVVYCAEAKVYHSHNFTIREVYKRYKEIGKFFKNNSWILEEVDKYSSAESTGFKQVKAELKYLLNQNPLLIPKSIIFSLTKYLAFKI